MKSRWLIGLLSFALGLNTALIVVTLAKVNRVERRLVERVARRPAAEGAVETGRRTPTRDREPEAPREGEEEGGRERFLIWGLPHVDPEELGLTAEQQQEIEALRAKWHEEDMQRRRTMLERREAMPDLFQDDEVTMAELQPFLDRAHEDSKARMEALLELYRAYQEILTPEQQARFKDMLKEQKERHHEMRREARVRMEKFFESRRGEGRPGPEGPRGDRVRRLWRREAPGGETEFGPGPMMPGPGAPMGGDGPASGPMEPWPGQPMQP